MWNIFINKSLRQSALPVFEFKCCILQGVSGLFSGPRRPHGAGPGQVPPPADGGDDHHRGGLGHVGR